MGDQNPSFVLEQPPRTDDLLEDVRADVGVDGRQGIVEVVQLAVVVDRPVDGKCF